MFMDDLLQSSLGNFEILQHDSRFGCPDINRSLYIQKLIASKAFQNIWFLHQLALSDFAKTPMNFYILPSFNSVTFLCISTRVVLPLADCNRVHAISRPLPGSRAAFRRLLAPSQLDPAYPRIDAPQQRRYIGHCPARLDVVFVQQACVGLPVHSFWLVARRMRDARHPA